MTRTEIHNNNHTITAVNPDRYVAGPAYRRVTITLDVALDMVPGAYHQVEDFLLAFTNNPYVQSASTAVLPNGQ